MISIHGTTGPRLDLVPTFNGMGEPRLVISTPEAPQEAAILNPRTVLHLCGRLNDWLDTTFK